MDEISHPLMSAHVPSFITRPGETDTLLVAMGIFLVLMIIGLGVLYFRLHALPEQMSHRGNNKAQFEIVAVLALLALFTHNNAFWVAALILAMIPLPDFSTPLPRWRRPSRISHATFGAEVHPAACPLSHRRRCRSRYRRTAPASEGVDHVRTAVLFDADDPAGLPHSPLRSGQRDHAVLGLV